MSKMSPIKRVLLVCSGNTARSPAAEYLAKQYSKEFEIDLEIDSAGFFNAFTYMQPESREYLKKKGIKHSDFVPKTISHKLLEKQDLIITMEQYHVDQILSKYAAIPEIGQKTYTLKEFNGEQGDIIDPYYTDGGTYKRVMKELDSHVERMIEKIVQLNQDN